MNGETHHLTLLPGARTRPGRSLAGAARTALLGGWLLSGVLLALALAVLVLAGHTLSWLVGLLAGAGVGAFVVLRAVRAGVADRPGELASRGTAQALATLTDAGWLALHDVVTPDGSYDHVAVGPGGVVLLQSVSADGTIVMHAGEPVVDHVDAEGRRRLQRLRPQARADAAQLREAIARCTGRRVWVQAAVVFWSEFPAGCVVDGRCVYVHGDRLAEWMRRRPHQLSADQVVDVVDDIASLAAARDELLALAV